MSADHPPEPGHSDRPAPLPPATVRAEPTTSKRPSTQPLDWRRVHLWQVQPVRDLLFLAAILGLIYLGYKISIVTVPLLLALFLAYLFEPLIQALTARGWFSRRGVVIGIIAAIVLVVAVPFSVGLTYAGIQGVNFASSLAGQIRLVLRSVESPGDDALRDKIRGEAWRDIRDWIVERRAVELAPALPPADGDPQTPAGSTPPGEPATADASPRQPAETASVQAAPVERVDAAAAAGDDSPVASDPDLPAVTRVPPGSTTTPTGTSVLTGLMGWIEHNAANIAQTVGRTAVGSGAQAVTAVFTTAGSLGKILFMAFLTAFFFFFVSTGWGRVLERGEQLIPDAGRLRWTQIIRRMDRVIAGFVRGRLLIAGILALFMTVAYWAIGVPAWMLLGPIVGLLFIVPFVHVLGVPIAMLLMWLQSDVTGFRSEWWWIVFAPIGVYLIAQFLDDWVLTPIIQGNNTDMDTPTILFASIAGGALAGIYGLLLAIPFAACIKILAHEFLWPRIEEWVKGRARDPLPISRE